MFLLVDNYDSFTYNLVHAFENQGVSPQVVRNDDASLLSLAGLPELEGVCISPGPSNPDNAGLCLQFLGRLPKKVPVLGVCLGHQILGQFGGADVAVNHKIMHGKQSAVHHYGLGLFSGLARPMTVARYHSLVVKEESCPDNLEITARTEEGEVMALRYKDRPWSGVQFHPESILTPEGEELLNNFLVQNGLKSQIVTPEEEKHDPLPLKISEVVETLARGEDLSEDVARRTFERLMDGELSPAVAGAMLLGLRAKGETSIELQMAAEAVLSRAVNLPGLDQIKGPVIDVVGTGGDSKFSFNCSTAAALTLAGMGYKVLKHGNRSVSSRCGSADVLEKIGISLDLAPHEVADTLQKDNFAFLFAVNMHPAFKHIMPVRRELGVRTLFNMLGPLTNPGRPSHRLIGVARQDMLMLIAESLANMGIERGAVVFGAGGYDELTPIGPAEVAMVNGSKVSKMRLDPAEFGFGRCKEEDLVIAGPEEGAEILRELLAGKGPFAMRDMLAMNVGLAVHVLERGKTLAESMREGIAAVNAGQGRRFIHA